MIIQISCGWRQMRPLLLLLLALPFLATTEGQQLIPAIARSPNPPPGNGANGDSTIPFITPDGRFVLFASTAPNLVTQVGGVPLALPFPPSRNVFLRDRRNGTTALVSVNLNGSGGGNGHSLPLALSTNGQFALFESDASNLVMNDTNHATDVFVRDVANGLTFLVSASTNGNPGNGASRSSVMTPDGRFVAFSSAAKNLVAGQTNYVAEIFVRDLRNNVTTEVSFSPNIGFYLRADAPALSPDGRYVAFLHLTNNYSAISQVASSVWISDLEGGTSREISTAAAALAGDFALFSATEFNAQAGYLAFAANFTITSMGFPTNLTGNIFRYNLATGNTDWVATNAALPGNDFAHFQSLELSADGNKIAFLGRPVISNVGATAVYVWDAVTGLTTPASGDATNGVQLDAACDSPMMDPTGRYVSFLSTATNLTATALSPGFHTYLRDLLAGTTQLLDLATNGVSGSGFCAAVTGITDDARLVAFDSTAENLTIVDDNQASDIFVRDRVNQTNELISVRQLDAHPLTLQTTTLLSGYAVSSNGQFLAIGARGSFLPPVNGATPPAQLILFDPVHGTNSLVSLNTNGQPCFAGICGAPSISTDGRRIVFTSSSPDLASHVNNSSTNIFVRDLPTGVTTLASLNSAGTADGSGASSRPQLAVDGNSLLFISQATDLAVGSFTGTNANLFWRNLSAGTTYAITTSGYGAFATTPDLRFVAYSSVSPPESGSIWDSQSASVIFRWAGIPWALSADGSHIASVNADKLIITQRSPRTNGTVATLASADVPFAQFSRDGQFLVYVSARALVAADLNNTKDVYLYDLAGGTNMLVSQSPFTHQAGDGSSDAAVLSPDGRFIAYRSQASNLVANDTNGQADVFLYDRLAGVTTLVSQNAQGNASGNYSSGFPQFSADSQTLFFLSWASDLVANDFNQAEDVFALKLLVNGQTTLQINQILFASGSVPNPTIVWTPLRGKTHALQYKNALTDQAWQNLGATITINGIQAWATDTTPNPGARFYRVVAF